MNSISPIDYDTIAPKYDARYAQNPLAGVARELRALVAQSQARDVLEVGCGTGHWVIELQPLVRRIVGLDYSFGMLEQARAAVLSLSKGQNEALLLTNSDANFLPFPSTSFDLVLSLNALQHYTDQRAFIKEAQRLLRPGGALAIVNLDPHIGRDRWYLYDYFDGVKDADLRRFPSNGTMLDWMLASGFVRAEWRVAERIHQEFVGREVLDNPFTQKGGSSQLAMLSDETYTDGLDRIRAVIENAKDKPPVFITDQWLTLLVGWNR